MPVLHLGVIDVPYQHEPEAPKKVPIRKGVRKGSAVRKSDFIGGGKTTGDVAEILEEKYHVMRIFFENKGQKIADSLVNSYAGALESLMMGAPIEHDPFGTAGDDIKELFTKFIDQKEMDTMGYPGVPTKAALMGRSKRFKRNKGPERPSFQDTGLYEDNFKAWGG